MRPTTPDRRPGRGHPIQRDRHLGRAGSGNEIVVRDLPPTYADEPFALGGTNTASNPVEQILGALGSLPAIGYTAGAVARGITIDDLRIDLTGAIDLPVFFGLKRRATPGTSRSTPRCTYPVGCAEGRDRSAPFGRLPDLARSATRSSGRPS